MLDKVEKYGDSVEEAVRLALKELKLDKDEVDVIVLEQPTKGFFGFHKKLAKVRVTRKPEPEKIPEPEVKTVSEVKTAPEPVRVKEEPVLEYPAETVSEDTVLKAEEKTEDKAAGAEKAEKPEAGSFFGGSTYVMSDPHNNASEADNNEYEEAAEEEAVEVLKPVRKRRSDRRRSSSSIMQTKFTITEADTDAVPSDDSYAAEFLRKIIHQMGLTSVKVQAWKMDDILYVSLTGNEVGSLIGKRGRTLDSLQYLASIIENKNSEKYTRVLVNAENYREKREKTLQQFARKIADKCARSGRSQRLEPMNPYERKVIHSTLQSDPRVTTRSEGSEPSRRVVIEVKK